MTVIFRLSNNSLSFNGCSNPASNTPACVGRFKKQPLNGGTWQTKTITGNFSGYSIISTDWTL